MTYPDDIIKAAREAAAQAHVELAADARAKKSLFIEKQHRAAAESFRRGERDQDFSVRALCIAIMAERQRCAEMEAKLASADLERRADDFMFSQLVGGQTKPRSYRAIFRRALKGRLS